jgi:hypothetical protein
MPLTDTEIKKSRPAEKAYRISDGSGLYVWVTPAGGKLWRWGYDFDSKEKLMVPRSGAGASATRGCPRSPGSGNRPNGPAKGR